MSYQQYRPSQFSILPTVVKNLLIINGLFFLATVVFIGSFHVDLTNILGLHFPLSHAFRPYQVVTYMFMHGSFMHLFFNMFALWMFGAPLENLWGPKRFLTYYVITGIGAAACHYAIIYYQIAPSLTFIESFLNNPSLADFETFLKLNQLNISEIEIAQIVSEIQHQSQNGGSTEMLGMAVDFMQRYRDSLLDMPVIVGASGSVFGILLAFGMLFPNTLLYLYFAIPIKAKWFVLLYGLAELYMGISNNPGDNVAHFAHLGGMLFGFILIKYWNKKNNY
jgi:membrane associated rhomboid family serine protease